MKMGFHKISAQDSMKSMISSESSDSVMCCTCTGINISSEHSDIERNTNEKVEDENLMHQSCFCKIFHAKKIKRIVLYIIG